METDKYFFIYNDKKIYVSENDYDILKEFKWRIQKPDNYVVSVINKKTIRLHRYIYINILNINIQDGYVIDHINGNKLDNRRSNLRMITFSENSRNKVKKQNATSQYYGVSIASNNKWQVSLNYNNNFYHAFYTDELHAAYQYNLWIEKFKLLTSKKNNITKPDNFTEFTPKQKQLPKGIIYIKHMNKYSVYFQIKKSYMYFGYFTNINDAIKVNDIVNFIRNQKINVLKQLKLLLNKQKNDDGNYIYFINNKEIIIDKDMYDIMYQFKWYINPQGYITNKKKLLHRYIMNCYDIKYIIDHINGNKLDNRRCNLRMVTQTQNSLNRKSKENSSSKYVGVHWNTKEKKWISQIQVNGVKICIGKFNDEKNAAIARDTATIKYFGEFGRLNFNKRLTWNMYFMQLAEVVKLRSPDFIKVGAIIISKNDNRILSTGYNGLPAGSNDNIDWENRELIGNYIIHAEVNALLYNKSTDDSILYVTRSPCKNCIKLISASNIKKVIYKNEHKDFKDVEKIAKILNIELIEFTNDF